MLRTAINRLFIIALFSWAIALPPNSCFGLEGQLNINTATVEELQKLPFVGTAKARAIVTYRRQHGPFLALDDLLLTDDAIGQSTLEAIQPYITLSGASTLAGSAKTLPIIPAGPNAFTSRRVIFTRPGEVKVLPDKDYYDVLLHFIQKSRHRIDMAMFLFKTTRSPKNRPAGVMRALIKARQRGVEVNVLLEKSGYDEKLNRENQRTAKKLRRNRVNVRFDSPGTTTHAKLVAIDGRYVFVGSHNLTHAALAYNHELSLLIDSRPLAGEISGYIHGLPSSRN